MDAAERAAWKAVAEVVEAWGGTSVADADGVEAVAVGTSRDGVLEVDVVVTSVECPA